MGRPLIYDENDVIEKVYKEKPNLVFNDVYSKYLKKHHWKCIYHPDIDIYRSPKILIERRSIGCPICNHKITKKTNDEALDICCQELMEYWDFDKNVGINPNNFTRASEFAVFWKCNKEHSFKSKIKDIVISYKNKNRFSCPYCENKKVLVGYNDLWTTHPDVAKSLKNPDDGYKYTFGSGVKVEWKCPHCNSINIDYVQHLTSKGGKCKFCSDNYSMPEKIMLNVLKQLGVNFKYQLTKSNFNWCKKYKYDFYLYDTNTIIETQGGQHYKEYCFGKSRNDKEIDDIKRNLALHHGINNYIEIDCRYSDFDYIKDNIIKSNLSNLYNLSNIDWKECHKNACNSIVLGVCEDYKNERPISYLLEKYQISNTTIHKYLHIGTELGLCNYDKQSSHFRALRGKYIYCKTTNKIFDSIQCAAKYYHISPSGVSSCANGNSSFSGKYNGEKLIWTFDLPINYNELDVIHSAN